jgi:hypothetical protein
MKELREGSKAELRARLDSEEGQRCLDEFAELPAEWAAKMMPTEILQALGTAEGSQSSRRAVARRRQRLLQSPLQPRTPQLNGRALKEKRLAVPTRNLRGLLPRD